MPRYLLIRMFVNLILLVGIIHAQPPTGTAVAPIPTLSYSEGEGIEYGGKLFVYHFGDGQRQPYRWSVILNAAKTTREKTDLYLFVDVPHALQDGSRIDVRIEQKNLLLEDYHGLGNHVDYLLDYTQKGNSRFLSEEYYSYHRKSAAVMANVQLPLFSSTSRLILGAGGHHTRLSAYPYPNKLENDHPFGMQGGWSNYLRFGLVIDKRDQEATPQRGYWTDILIEPSFRLIGSDYEYTRTTLTHRYYIPLHRRVILAQRLVYERMAGSPPFYEMAVISGSFQRQEGLGGCKSLRGMPRLLFVGRDKFLSNLELRYRFHEITILKQHLTWYLHLFCDAGRVWMKDDPFTLKDLHFTQGLGIHVQWRKDFIGAIDIGRSAYLDYALYLTFGTLF